MKKTTGYSRTMRIRNECTVTVKAKKGEQWLSFNGALLSAREARRISKALADAAAVLERK